MALMNKFKKIFWILCNKLLFKHLGKKSYIKKPLMLNGKKYISLGNNVNFREGARIECVDKWLDKKFEPSIIVGDNTVFEQHIHLTTAGTIEIGKNCSILARTMITSIEHDYSKINIPILKQKINVSNVKIGDNCFIGMDVKIFPGVSIGDNVIIGANSIVMCDLPSYTVAVGTPAKVIKKYDFGKGLWIKI